MRGCAKFKCGIRSLKIIPKVPFMFITGTCFAFIGFISLLELKFKTKKSTLKSTKKRTLAREYSEKYSKKYWKKCVKKHSRRTELKKVLKKVQEKILKKVLPSVSTLGRKVTLIEKCITNLEEAFIADKALEQIKRLSATTSL